MEYLLKPGDLYFRNVVPVFLFSNDEFLLPALIGGNIHLLPLCCVCA